MYMYIDNLISLLLLLLYSVSYLFSYCGNMIHTNILFYLLFLDGIFENIVELFLNYLLKVWLIIYWYLPFTYKISNIYNAYLISICVMSSMSIISNIKCGREVIIFIFITSICWILLLFVLFIFLVYAVLSVFLLYLMMWLYGSIEYFFYDPPLYYLGSFGGCLSLGNLCHC